LRLSSVSVRHEILNCQKRWFEELSVLGKNGTVFINYGSHWHNLFFISNRSALTLPNLSSTGENLKMVTNAAEKYHAALADNRKLFNEIQELKGTYLKYIN
jgi:kinesin family member C2/C3